MEAKVTYQAEIISKNTQLDPMGASCISFELLGDDPATIMGDIPLTENKIREFNNDPGQTIESNFPIRFEGTGAVKKILIVRTFYNK